MRTVFVYWGPHELHEKWADTVTFEHYSFIPWVEKLRTIHPIFHQLLAMLSCWRIPKADVYLVENTACLLPVLLRKWKDSVIIAINSDNYFNDAKSIPFFVNKIDGFVSTSKMINDIAMNVMNRPSVIVTPGIEKKWFKVKADMDSPLIAHGMSEIRKQKGSDLVIEAFSKLKNRGLKLIGPMSKDIGLDGYEFGGEGILFTGRVPDPENYVKDCGVYVNPARLEPFGLNIIEAMATGLAPIVTDRCGAAEIVKRLDKRLIIKPNVKEIIKAIKWVDKNKKRLYSKARRIAKEYTIEKSCKKFKKEFYKLARCVVEHKNWLFEKEMSRI